MSKNNKDTNVKQDTMEKMRNSEAVYVILSDYTHMPYVACDPETFDDEVFLYFEEDDAKEAVERFAKDQEITRAARLEKNGFLAFYTNLFAMGVNCIMMNQGTGREVAVQLGELVRRPEADKLPAGQVRIENPEFHLTALYYMQKLRKSRDGEDSEQLKELNEELMAHFKAGRYIVAVQEGQGIPMLQKEGQVYQPLFTDFQEFQKFDREKKFKTAVVEAGKITEFLSSQAVGVVLNPMGVNLLLNIAR